MMPAITIGRALFCLFLSCARERFTLGHFSLPHVGGYFTVSRTGTVVFTTISNRPSLFRGEKNYQGFNHGAGNSIWSLSALAYSGLASIQRAECSA
jgi:hypothetical protein